jgi:hypothetical protein
MAKCPELIPGRKRESFLHKHETSNLLLLRDKVSVNLVAKHRIHLPTVAISNVKNVSLVRYFSEYVKSLLTDASDHHIHFAENELHA